MYINIHNESPTISNNCFFPQKIIISKELFFDSLSKKQLELIKVNDKSKLIKTLNHMPLLQTEIQHLRDLILNKNYLLNNELLTSANIQKLLLKFWEIEINRAKELRTLTLSDIELIEEIVADKYGFVFPLNKNGNNINNTLIEIILGVLPNNKNFNELNKDIYLIDKFTNNIEKTIGNKTEYYKTNSYKEAIPTQKQNKQIISDSEILKLNKISQEINSINGQYKNIEFAILNNKIYILSLEDVKLSLSTNTLITWENVFSEIKTKTTPLSFSIQNIIHKSYIQTISDIFFSTPDKYSELLFFNNCIYNKKNEIIDILKNSPVFLYNPQYISNKFKLFKNIKEIPTSKNNIYILEYLRFYCKLFITDCSLDKELKKLQEIFDNIQTKTLVKQDFSVFSIICILEETISLLEKVISLNLRNSLLIDYKQPQIIKSNKLYNIYRQSLTDIDKEIFTKTHKHKYFVSAKIEQDDNVSFINFTEANNIQTESIRQNKYYIQEEELFVLQNEIFYFMKQLTKELGLNLALVGILNEVNDIYLLTFEEIQNFKFKLLDNNLKELFVKRKSFNEFNEIIEEFSSNPEFLDKAHSIKFKDKKLTQTEEININKIFNHMEFPDKELIIDSHYRTNYYKTVLSQLSILFKEN